MKSMVQMQSEMLAKCKFDGSFPRPVVLPLGILALARNQEEYDSLNREAAQLIYFAGIVAVFFFIKFRFHFLGNMTCKNCKISETSPRWGGYDRRCLHCCARLVMSAHPDKKLAASMLAAIQRVPGSPGRAQVLECVSQRIGKRP